MHRSTDRFLTTHTGSLPRPDDLIKSMFAKEEGVPVDPSALERRVADAVAEVVRKQAEAGVDVINDGEMSKPSYATYIKDRLAGFGGEGNTFVYQDLAAFPRLEKRVFGDPGRSRRKTPACNAPITVRDPDAAKVDVSHLKAALASVTAREGFLTGASPGVISLFFRNQHYRTEEEYVHAIAEAMRPEYETITRGGFVLQIDCPDLGMGRHIQYAHLACRNGARRPRCTWKRSTRRRATFRPSSCACTFAGATTKGRTIATCRSATSSTSCSRRGPARSRSRRRTRATRTSGSCSRPSSCPTARC
jgi:5-methyltetrahydropteroyltriglutamate--homocysteine methyltransferase